MTERYARQDLGMRRGKEIAQDAVTGRLALY